MLPNKCKHNTKITVAYYLGNDFQLLSNKYKSNIQ